MVGVKKSILHARMQSEAKLVNQNRAELAIARAFKEL